MNQVESFLLSLIVLFPAISGVIRWKQISPRYRPFIILMMIAVLTEVINYIAIDLTSDNNAVINIYSLVESLLIISQFYFWRYYSNTRRWYPWFGIACIIIWIVENLVISKIGYVGTVFRISSAFVLITLSINEINYIIINESRNLLRNARFLICTSFLIYFLYQLLLEGSLYISAQGKNAPVDQLIYLYNFMNGFINIIYGIAVWFIPKRTSLHFKNTEEGDIFHVQ